MEISFKFEGFEEVQRGVEALASPTEMRTVNKKIFQRSADVTEPRMKNHMPKSADNSRSGKRARAGKQSYIPPGHARDNIPKKVTSTKAEVGWKLNGDAENWFYMKFVEWGTTKMRPARDFINNTKEESEPDYHRIAEEEYQRFLNQKLKG